MNLIELLKNANRTGENFPGIITKNNWNRLRRDSSMCAVYRAAHVIIDGINCVYTEEPSEKDVTKESCFLAAFSTEDAAKEYISDFWKYFEKLDENE